MKLPSLTVSLFVALTLLAMFSQATAADSPDSCGTTNNENTDPPGCDAAPPGNSSNGDKGPLTHAPTHNTGTVPNTGQSFMTPNTSNGWNSAVDLEIHRHVSEIPFHFRRTYQSRAKGGLGDEFGHGQTWGHTFGWRMSYAGNSERAVTFPDGRIFLFKASGTTQFDGITQILHKPESGRGEFMYQSGAGDHTFTLVMPDAKRHIFERVINADSTVTYHPRYSQDSVGRRITYTSDVEGRIVTALDPSGATISLEYGPIQINRKASISLHKVLSTPSTGWNEVILTSPQPFRWLQAVSSRSSAFNLSEVEFYGPDGNGGHTKLSGTVYGTTPASGRAPTDTFEKAFDGDVNTGYLHARPGGGIAGIDLGAGNESHVSKIRFKPRTGQIGSKPMTSLKWTRFQGVTEAPEIVNVLQRVTSSDGRAVNYIYDTIVDESIGQSHLVLSGVDYDGDMLADVPTDAQFTYVFSNPGRAPSVETFYEPRSRHNVPHLKFEYRSTLTATRGMVGKVLNAENNELIFKNEPKSKRTLTFPGDRETVVRYNNVGIVSSVTNAEDNRTSYTYDANGFLTSTTDAAGRTTTYTYNFRGQRLTKTSPDGLTQTVTYDPATSRMISLTDSAPGYADRTTTWVRDASSRVTRKNYPDGSYETYTYNTLGLVTEKRERNGSLTTRTYDATGLCLTFTQATGTPEEETITYTFYGDNDPTGSPARLLKSETDPRGRTTSYEYDLRGQRTKTTYPDGSSRTYTYDFAGNKISETDGNATQLWTYNSFNKVTSKTDPLGHYTQYYYGVGGIVCGCFNGGGPTMIVSAEGRLTLREYDLLWRLKTETVGHASPAAATTEYLYDPVGNLAMKVLPDGVIETYTHDVADRVISSTIEGPDGLGGKPLPHHRPHLHTIWRNSYLHCPG